MKILFLNGVECYYVEIDVVGLYYFVWCEIFFLELILLLYIRNVFVNLRGWLEDRVNEDKVIGLVFVRVLI